MFEEGYASIFIAKRGLQLAQRGHGHFLYWEMFFPSLTLKKLVGLLGWLDEQLLGAAAYKRLQAWDERTFGPYRHMHDMSLWNPEEDQFVMAAAFVAGGTLAFQGVASAHGGQYRGPGDTVPPGGGGGGGAGAGPTSGPAGPAAPGPSGPGISGETRNSCPRLRVAPGP